GAFADGEANDVRLSGNVARAGAVSGARVLHRRERAEARCQHFYDGGASGRDQLQVHAAAVNGRVAQQLDGCGRRNGEHAMRALHRATANVQRRADPLVHIERFAADGGAHNVYQRVGCADLVEVESVDGGIVDPGFGGAECLEDGDRGFSGALADRGGGDDLFDL